MFWVGCQVCFESDVWSFQCHPLDLFGINSQVYLGLTVGSVQGRALGVFNVG